MASFSMSSSSSPFPIASCSKSSNLVLTLNLKPSFLCFPNSLFSTTRTSPRQCAFCSANSTPQGSESVSIVGDLLHYLNESWTHFHATAEAKRQLIVAGFHLLNENGEWDLKPGGRYFFTRNMSFLVAFTVGENGAHDSPCLKLKPKTASSKSAYSMVNVQTYGGGLWHTWFDRDLSVARRVILKSSDNSYLRWSSYGCLLHENEDEDDELEQLAMGKGRCELDLRKEGDLD
ncbi:Peptidase M18 [Sesbania bispinosa]|nr:Peptidase M18 [Sesbania bispinosa]